MLLRMHIVTGNKQKDSDFVGNVSQYVYCVCVSVCVNMYLSEMRNLKTVLLLK